MIYFTSDTHLGHINMIKGISTWEDKTECRDFLTLEEHDNLIIDNINDTVGKNDILYHLGDFCMGPRDNVWKYRKRLKVKQLHFVVGNHDHHIINNSIVKKEEGYINTYNLFTSISQYIDTKIMGQNMMLCHYAMRNWHKGSSGSWMLHGHSHGNLPYYFSHKMRKIKHPKQEIYSIGYFKTKDVGIDTHPEFRPYSFEELKEEFDKYKYVNLDIDHHGVR